MTFRTWAPLVAVTTLSAAPGAAHAFCGFYVTGAEAGLYNNATQAVLMRQGTRTALSIQNNYKGPPEDFAMVVPVPIILQAENVKTLSQEHFAKIDTLSAPRLVEYWEQDPCALDLDAPSLGGSGEAVYAPEDSGGSPPVQVEAEFVVGEYNVVVLSASDATSLESWLTTNNYNVPEGSAPYLDPYVQQGMYFFVAEVDSTRVTYVDGRAVLSPLRFHYDSEEFSLPIRLGLINASGPQDLIVYILGDRQRYDVANYPNVTIPTNIYVEEQTAENFFGFYEALYQATLDHTPGAVITEYSWDAGSCDPCPGPTLESEDYAAFGADVMPNGWEVWSWVLTRLHARYTTDTLGADLVFREASPIAGGRQFIINDAGDLEQGAVPYEINNFQGRYIILHPWEGPVLCLDPEYGIPGGPPDGEGGQTGLSSAATSPNTNNEDPAQRQSGAVNLSDYLDQDIPEIGVESDGDEPNKACSCAGSGREGAAAAGLALLGVVALRRRLGRVRRG